MMVKETSRKMLLHLLTIVTTVCCALILSGMTAMADTDPEVESIEYTPVITDLVMDKHFDYVDEWWEYERSDLHPRNMFDIWGDQLYDLDVKVFDEENNKTDEGYGAWRGIHNGDILTVHYSNGEQKIFKSTTSTYNAGAGSGEMAYCICWYDINNVPQKNMDVSYKYKDYVKHYSNGGRVPGIYNTKVTVTYAGKQTDYMMKITAAGPAKKKNPIVVKPKRVTVSYSKLRKSGKDISRKTAMTVKAAKGIVSYKKISGPKKIKIGDEELGVIEIGKKLKRGTYKLKIQVTCAGNSRYMAAKRIVTIKIKVK